MAGDRAMAEGKIVASAELLDRTRMTGAVSISEDVLDRLRERGLPTINVPGAMKVLLDAEVVVAWSREHGEACPDTPDEDETMAAGDLEPSGEALDKEGRSGTRLLDERATARYIGMSRSFLRKSRMGGIREGHTPGPPWVKLGRTIRYDIHDLDGWIADRICRPAGAPG